MQITDDSHQLMELNRLWGKDRLLVSGGILDQPNVYLEAMKFIDSERDRLLKKKDTMREKSGK